MPTEEIVVAPSELARFAQAARQLTMASPEVASQKPLRELVEEMLVAACRSRNTRRAYTIAAGLFFTFLEQQRGQMLPDAWRPLVATVQEGKRTHWEFGNCPAAVIWLVDAALLDSFAFWREEQGDALATVGQRMAAIKTLLAVALRSRILTGEQAEMLGVRPYTARQQRDDDPVGRRLTPVEVRALRAVLGKEQIKDLRDRAILDIMLYAGLRRAEVAELQCKAFVQDRGRWWIRLRGKGRKTRRVKIHDVLFQSLSDWFAQVGLRWQGNAEQPVFCSINKGGKPSGRPIDPNVVYEMVGRVGSLAKAPDRDGVLRPLATAAGESRLRPHDLRRTFARNAHDNGASITQVQSILGHADVKTTIRYIGLDVPDDDTAVDHVRY